MTAPARVGLGREPHGQALASCLSLFCSVGQLHLGCPPHHWGGEGVGGGSGWDPAGVLEIVTLFSAPGVRLQEACPFSSRDWVRLATWDIGSHGRVGKGLTTLGRDTYASLDKGSFSPRPMCVRDWVPVCSCACGPRAPGPTVPCVHVYVGHLSLSVSVSVHLCLHLCASFTPQVLELATCWAGQGCKGDQSRHKSSFSGNRHLGVERDRQNR